MLILSDHHLKSLLKERTLQICPAPSKEALNPTSIDLRLGPILLKYSHQLIRLGAKEPVATQEIDMEVSGGHVLAPGDFVLGTTIEQIVLPNGFQGFIETKGNIARAGLQVHNGDGHIDPGFKGHITLEIKNMHKEEVPIKLMAGIYICQLFIYPTSSLSDLPYNGKYLHQVKPTPYFP